MLGSGHSHLSASRPLFMAQHNCHLLRQPPLTHNMATSSLCPSLAFCYLNQLFFISSLFPKRFCSLWCPSSEWLLAHSNHGVSVRLGRDPQDLNHSVRALGTNCLLPPQGLCTGHCCCQESHFCSVTSDESGVSTDQDQWSGSPLPLVPPDHCSSICLLSH